MAEHAHGQDLAWQQTWSNAETWADLLDLSRRYLKSDIDISASCNHAVEAESIEIRSGLLRLHDFGLLTISSQPEVRAGPPGYSSPKELAKSGGDDSELPPKHQLAYVQKQLRALKEEFTQEQLDKNVEEVISWLQNRRDEIFANLGFYVRVLACRGARCLYSFRCALENQAPRPRADEGQADRVVNSDSGATNTLDMYERELPMLIQEDIERYENRMSLRWAQNRQDSTSIFSSLLRIPRYHWKPLCDSASA